MRILRTGMNETKGKGQKVTGGNAAFTLIELVVVIFIISLTTALIMPNVWDSGERAVKSEAKRIGNTLRYIHDEAIGKKRVFLFTFNLDDDYWEYKSEKNTRTFRMKDKVIFKDILVPSLGEVEFGEVTLTFRPTGPDEPVTIHLVKDEAEYTVIFNHINGRAKLYEGYKL